MSSHQISSTARQLMAKAQSLAGIDDIDDKEIELPLEQLLKSLNTEAQLTAHGVVEMEKRLLRLLSNRLRMQRDFRRHPEINDQKIVRPVIMTGAARTGSTKLAKLLSASGDFLYFKCWQGLSMSLISGDRDEDPAERIRVADEECRWFNAHAPKARLIHEYSTFEPEEETLFYEHILFAPFMMTIAFVPGFVQWFMEHRDIERELDFLEQSLKYFQWQFHDGDPRPLLLKTPIYNGSELALAQRFPDARFVATHREPVAVMSSSVSLQVLFKNAYSDIDLSKVLGPMVLEGLAMGIDAHMAAREQRPDLAVLDVNYSELTKDSERVAEKVYAHAGLVLSDRARQAMAKWESENTQHKQGVHKHSLEDFLLTQEMVRTRYQRYIDRFAHCF